MSGQRHGEVLLVYRSSTSRTFKRGLSRYCKNDPQIEAPKAMPLKKTVIDVISIVILAILFCIFEFVIPPYRRGYFCDDDSIRYNYKANTIPAALLFGVGTGIPIVLMGITECVRYYLGILKTAQDLWKALYKDFFFFMFGAFCTQLLTDIGKCSVGRLRPHFLAVCNSTYVCNLEEHIYITDYVCQGDADVVKEARFSFPSGHSTFAAYTMVYVALFLQFRFRWKGSDFLRPLTQISLIGLAFYIGLSRISDNMHNWSDVLTGFVIGIMGAVLSILVVSDLFQRPRIRVSSDEMVEA